MARVPCQKGTSVLPVVAALKAHPDRKKVVPGHLWKYFDDLILVSGWYPERDYFELLDALSRAVDPETVKGDFWRYLARFSVQMDITGRSLSGANSAGGKGVYRSFATINKDDPGAFFRKAMKIWPQYHDTGTMQIRGGRVATNSVVMDLKGFHIPLEGFVRLQGYYLEEFGLIVGLELRSKVTQSTAHGDSFCEWDCALGRTAAAMAFVASLPAMV